MKSRFCHYVMIFILYFLVWFPSVCSADPEPIEVYSGTGMSKPMNDIAKIYEQKTGIPVNITFKSAGQSMVTMHLTKSGDVFFPGSEVFLERGVEEGIIVKKDIHPIATRTPVIMVRSGNPKNINKLSDIYEKHTTNVAFCLHDEKTTLGKLARKKILTKRQLELLQDNIVSVEASLALVASKIALEVADAGFGWLSYARERKKIDAVQTPELDKQKIKLSISPTKYAKDYEAALKFVKFVASEKGKKYFEKYNFTVILSD